MIRGGLIKTAVQELEMEPGELIVPMDTAAETIRRLTSKDMEGQIVAATCGVGIDPTSEAYADLIKQVSERLREAAAVIHDVVDAVVAAINEAWKPVAAAWEEILELLEEYADIAAPEKEDRHDGAVEVLVAWLPLVPTLYELYGQGVDHGGPGPIPSDAEPRHR